LIKIIFTAVAALLIILTIIDKIRVAFGKKNPESHKKFRYYLLYGMAVCFLLMLIIGYQYYLHKDNSILSNALFPLFILVILVDQWRRTE
jgi:hypothetical protein